MSGITTCSREPSGSIASTNGVDRSTRRPEDFSIFSTRSRTSSAVRIVVVSSCTPRRAMNTLVGSLIQISSTVGSSRYFCSGPKPATASNTCRAASRASTQLRQGAAEAALVVLGDDLVDQAADGGGVGDRVQPAAADELADLVLDDADGVHAGSPMDPTGSGSVTTQIGHANRGPGDPVDDRGLWTEPTRAGAGRFREHCGMRLLFTVVDPRGVGDAGRRRGRGPARDAAGRPSATVCSAPVGRHDGLLYAGRAPGLGRRHARRAAAARGGRADRRPARPGRAPRAAGAARGRRARQRSRPPALARGARHRPVRGGDDPDRRPGRLPAARGAAGRHRRVRHHGARPRVHQRHDRRRRARGWLRPAPSARVDAAGRRHPVRAWPCPKWCPSPAGRTAPATSRSTGRRDTSGRRCRCASRCRPSRRHASAAASRCSRSCCRWWQASPWWRSPAARPTCCSSCSRR